MYALVWTKQKAANIYDWVVDFTVHLPEIKKFATDQELIIDKICTFMNEIVSGINNGR